MHLYGRTPVDGTFLGSNNSSVWDVIQTFSGLYTSSDNQKHTINITNSSQKLAYRYIRFVITKIHTSSVFNGGGLVEFRELEYYGTPEYDPEADGVDVVVKSVPNVPNTDWLEVYYDGQDYSADTDFAGAGGVDNKTGVSTYDATPINGVGFDTEYKAFTFDANSSQYLSSSTPVSGNYIHTISMWFKGTNLTSTGGDILMWVGDNTDNKRIEIYIENDLISYNFRNNGYIADTTFQNNRWYHLTCTYNGTQGSAGREIYVDGQRLSAYHSGNLADLNITNSTLNIGGFSVTSTTYMFSGSIANFRLFNRALTSDEIYQLYAYQKEYFGHGDLGMTLKAGRLGIGTSEPRVALDVRGDVIAKGLREDAGRDYILSLAPNIWSVGGDSNDRITSGAINLGPHTFIQKVSGRSVWVMGAEDTYVDIMSVISSTDTTVTQAIALGLPMGVYKAGILANQIKGGTTTGHTNHTISYSASKGIAYDNFSPGGGGIITTSTLDMSKESILVVRRNGNTASFWYNGVKFEEISYTETFNGTAPDRTRLGARDLVAVFNNTPIGLGFGAYAAWERALTDIEIRYLTYDKMTSI
jgi:hypothetical protein